MSIYDFIIRLVIVLVIGFSVGLERQLTGHNTSYKTTTLIAVGSYIFIATEVFIGSDATRMAANVITGIGFLCSGVIFKNGFSVNGLTTAATLWCTSAIAVLVGYGYIIEGVIGACIVVVSNIVTSVIFNRKDNSAFSNNSDVTYTIKVECERSDVKKIKKAVLEGLPKKIILNSIDVETLPKSKYQVTFQMSSKDEIVSEVSDICDKVLGKNAISVTYERSEE